MVPPPPPPTPICERPCICAVGFPRSTLLAYWPFPQLWPGQENRKWKGWAWKAVIRTVTITVCQSFTRFHQNIDRPHMTLHPDLCTSSALYFFPPVFYSNVGKNVLLFYFICVFMFYCFIRCSPIFSPHWKSLKETHLYLDFISTVDFVMDQANQLWPVPLRQPLQPESSWRFLCHKVVDGIGSASDVHAALSLFACFKLLLTGFRGIISCLLFPYRAAAAADASWLSQPSLQGMADFPFQIDESGNRELFTQH